MVASEDSAHLQQLFTAIKNVIRTIPKGRVAAYGQTDASLRYNLTPTMSLYADLINVNNAKRHVYADNLNEFMTLENVGRRYNVGLRMAF